MSHEHFSGIILSTTRKYALKNANNMPLVRADKNYFMNPVIPS